MFFFFCKHNTAYEMRISDWSSDVCSSDLVEACRLPKPGAVAQYRSLTAQRSLGGPLRIRRPGDAGEHAVPLPLHPARRPWHGDIDAVHARSEERRGGKACGSTCRHRRVTDNAKNTKYTIQMSSKDH